MDLDVRPFIGPFLSKERTFPGAVELDIVLLIYQSEVCTIVHDKFVTEDDYF